MCVATADAAAAAKASSASSLASSALIAALRRPFMGSAREAIR